MKVPEIVIEIVLLSIVILAVIYVGINLLEYESEQIKLYCLDNPNGELTGDMHIICNFTPEEDYGKTSKMGNQKIFKYER